MGLFFLPNVAVFHAPMTRVDTVATTTPISVDDVVPLSKQHFNVTMTSYNAVPEQTDGSPFITASGAYSNPNVVVARSRDLAKKLPFGTVIAIEPARNPSHTCGYGIVKPQVGYRVVADTMNASKHNQVDILLDQKNKVRVGRKVVNPSIALGICHNMIIRVVGHINVLHIPKTQKALVSILTENTKTLAIR